MDSMIKSGAPRDTLSKARDAFYAIQRGSSFYKIKGSNLSGKLQTGDLLVVARGGDPKKFTYAGSISRIRDDDFIACEYNGEHYKVIGSVFKNLFAPKEPWKDPMYNGLTLRLRILSKSINIGHTQCTNVWKPDGSPVALAGVSDITINYGDSADNIYIVAIDDKVAPFSLSEIEELERRVANGEKDLRYDKALFQGSEGNFEFIEADTSNVTMFDAWFNACNEFEGRGVELFDTSKAITLEALFASMRAFNGDVTGWDVSQVRNFSGTFMLTYVFNQDISKWNTENATPSNPDPYLDRAGMRQMFDNAYAFDQDLSGWCVPNVKIEPLMIFMGSAMESKTAQHPDWGYCP